MRVVINRLASVFFCLALVVLAITASIGLPIYVRPFYYAQVEPLAIPERTGRTTAEVREAYDQLLDYLTLPGKEFGTGVFPYSEEGKSHFADCKGLFALNGWLLLGSAALTLMLGLLHRHRLICLCRPRGHGLSFPAGVITLVSVALIGLLVAVDFEQAFHVFHTLFFPGKDNWLFSATQDPIIRALPQAFFRNCALLIGGSILILSITAIALGIVKKADSSPAKG